MLFSITAGSNSVAIPLWDEEVSDMTLYSQFTALARSSTKACGLPSQCNSREKLGHEELCEAEPPSIMANLLPFLVGAKL